MLFKVIQTQLQTVAHCLSAAMTRQSVASSSQVQQYMLNLDCVMSTKAVACEWIAGMLGTTGGSLGSSCIAESESESETSSLMSDKGSTMPTTT